MSGDLSWSQIMVLAIVQGLTEFLPVSSSAHLLMVPHLFNWPDQGLVMDVAVHFGTLLAVLQHFRGRLFGWLRSDWRELLAVAVATIPVGLLGLLARSWLASPEVRSLQVVAWMTIVFGGLLGFAQWRYRASARVLTWRVWLALGCAQAVALIPGVSRSGVVLTMALLLRLPRAEAANATFILGIPTMVLACGLLLVDLLQQLAGPASASALAISWPQLALAVLLAYIVGLLCIKAFMRLIRGEQVIWWFVGYRLFLGCVLVAFPWGVELLYKILQ